jgi:penicillin-binding protein 2
MTDNSRVRVSIVGVVIVALFCSLVARLWFLQMGPEQELKARAIALSTREVQTPSPRGQIKDRNGVVLARDRAAWAVTLERDLKKDEHEAVIGRLSELLKVEGLELEAAFTSPRQSPLLPAVIRLDVPLEQRLAIQERPDSFPGVGVQLLTVRSYPTAFEKQQPALASHVLGYVGEVNEEQLKELKKRGYKAGDLIGRDGVEAAFESTLRGTPTITRFEVDPRGQQVGPSTVVQPGSVGNDVTLTLDVNVQLAAERALDAGIQRARSMKDEDASDLGFHNYRATAGAVVVLDARDGSVVAMASNPSFEPQKWVGGVSQADFDFLQNKDSHNPLVNRATQGQYLPGSTFKLVGATAQTRYGFRGPWTPYDDEGRIIVGTDTRSFANDGNRANGVIDLSEALTLSSDTYFYSDGLDFYNAWEAGDKERGLGMQAEARMYGFGAKTGIEIAETDGRVPDPEWKKAFAEANYKDKAQRDDFGSWYPGDQVNFAVGQGGLAVTPLQLADAYGAFLNNGTLWKPHIGLNTTDPGGKVLTAAQPTAIRNIPFDPLVHSRMLEGFRGAVQNEKGTAYQAFAGFPHEAVGPGGVAGKTGTAQAGNDEPKTFEEYTGPTSWFAGMFPAAPAPGQPQYVVVAVVEEGGYGARIAAPIARSVIESMNNLPVSEIRQVQARD